MEKHNILLSKRTENIPHLNKIKARTKFLAFLFGNLIFFTYLCFMKGNNNITKIIKAIINGLENNSIIFNNDFPSSSQLGLISQSIHSYSQTRLREYINDNYYLYRSGTWKDWILLYWPIAGTPSSQISLLVSLYKLGFSRDDVIYFEYLSDPEVVSKLDLEFIENPIYETQTRKTVRPKIKELFYHEEQYRKDWWGKLWGLKETVKITFEVEDGVEEFEIDETVQIGTEKIKKNLNPKSKKDTILYLKKWIEIYGREV